MWLRGFRSFSTRLQTDWASDHRLALGTAFRYSNSELVEMTAMLGEMTPADVKRLGLRETTLDDFLKILKSRLKAMGNDEITTLCQHVFDNKELKSFSLRTGFWPSMGTHITAIAQSLTYSQLSNLNVILTHLGINHIHIRQAQLTLEDQLQTRPFSTDFSEFANVLWAASFPGIETPFIRRIVTHLLTEVDTSQVSLGLLSKSYSFLKRCVTDSAQLDVFYEREMTTKLQEKCAVPDLVEALAYAVPYSLGSEELRNRLEDALVRGVQTAEEPLESVHLTRLLQTYIYIRAASGPLFATIFSEVKRCADQLNVKEMVEAAVVCSRIEGGSETVKRLEQQFAEAMKKGDETVISHNGCLAMIRTIYVSGLSMPFFLNHIVSYVESLFEKMPPSLGIAVRMASMLSHMRFSKPSFHQLLHSHMWQVRSSARNSPHDLINVLSVLTEHSHLSSHDLLLLLENLTFFSSSRFEWWNLTRAVYAFSKVNRGTPELFELLKKRTLEADVGDFTDFHNLALGVFAYTQVNQGDYIEHLFPAVKAAVKDIGVEVDIADAIIQQQPKYNPAYRPFLHTKMRVPAASVVQLCWGMAASKLSDELWTPAVLSHLESIDYSPSAIFSSAVWHRIAMLLQRNTTYTSKVDLFHYHLLVNTLALAYSTRLSKAEAVAKVREKVSKAPKAVVDNLERYRFRVNAGFKKDVFGHLSALTTKAVFDTADQLGNPIDALINGQTAVILTDQEDYVYLSEGYKRVEGTKDLFGSLKTKVEVVRMQGMSVEVVARGTWEKLTKTQKVDTAKGWLRGKK